LIPPATPGATASNAASASSNRDADGATRYDKHARHYAGATTWPRY
jgi:hypothetical protein